MSLSGWIPDLKMFIRNRPARGTCEMSIFDDPAIETAGIANKKLQQFTGSKMEKAKNNIF